MRRMKNMLFSGHSVADIARAFKDEKGRGEPTSTKTASRSC